MRQRLISAARTRPFVWLICGILAATLTLSLVHYSQYTPFSPQDDAGPAQFPIFVIQGVIKDFWCHKPDEVCAISTWRGFFARDGVPPLAAVLAGVLLPALLLLSGTAYAVHKRWAWMLALIFAAVICFYELVSYGPRLVETHSDPNIYYAFLSNTPAEAPLLETRRELDCGPGIRPFRACSSPHEEWHWGYYPAAGAPRYLALLLGVILPLAMILIALGLAVDTVRRRWRTV